MATAYEDDLAGWAKEQAFWLRSGRASLVDSFHLAEEIEGRGTSLVLDLGNRFSMLLAHLARWQRQEGNRCELWHSLIDLQRPRMTRIIKRTPSLASVLDDPEFLHDAWLDALIKVIGKNACHDLPDTSPWTLQQALAQDFFPE